MNANRSESLARNLHGLLLPITTPFQADRSINFNGLRSNIQKWNSTEITGYVVLGSTGERVNLDESEQLKVIAAAREVVPEDRVFIAGVGQQGTLGTINEIKRTAAAVSLDAVLVITPHFYRAAITQPALVDHYVAVADASPVPLVLYSMPALTGIKVEPETAARLSSHENIVGIKDSSADIAGLQETIRLTSDSFLVLTGNGTVFYPGLQAGACGGILAVGCAAPSICSAIYRAAKLGDDELATRLQTALRPLAEAVTTRFGIGGLKAALDMRGFAGGAVREPLRAPGDQARDEIRQRLDEADEELKKTSMAAEVLAVDDRG